MPIKNRIVRSGSVKVADCVVNPNNWRLHPKQQYEAMEGILDEVGWVKGITINESTGNMVDGHLRLLIAERRGEEEIPADWIEVTEEEEKKILLTLDPLANMATVNKNKHRFLQDQTRFKDKALQEMMAKQASKHGIYDEDEEPEVWDPNEDETVKLQKKWKTELGQLWQLGNHKLLCADSTDPESWKKIMKGEKASMVFTDPPYGVDYEYSKLGKIEGDALVDNKLTQMLKKAFEHAVTFAEDTAAFYIWHATSTRRDFEWMLDQVGLIEKQYIIWIKDNFTMGWYDYQWQTEPCFYCEKAGKKAKFYGNRGQSTVWQVSRITGDNAALTIANGLKISDGIHQPVFFTVKPIKTKVRHFRVEEDKFINIRLPGETDAWQIQRSKTKDYYHPTQKPTALAMIGVNNSSLPGQIVVDPFAGSGFTLLACEKTGRKCHAMDLDPKWCAATLERYQLASGQKPKLISSTRDTKQDTQEKTQEKQA